jgi:hypothetical protein
VLLPVASMSLSISVEVVTLFILREGDLGKEVKLGRSDAGAV